MKSRFHDALRLWLPPLLTIVCVRSAVASPFHVPTGSMVPTIEIGDRILVSKLAYGLQVPWIDVDAGLSLQALSTREVLTWAEPDRGDVLLFRSPPEPGVDYVKRVVGVPGDVVSVRSGVVRVNGEPIRGGLAGEHPFVDEDCHAWPGRAFEESIEGHRYEVLDSVLREGPDYGPVVVPEGSLFVLGDNRDHSRDSRYWGMLPRERVRGRVMAVWMSHGCDGETRMRWRSL